MELQPFLLFETAANVENFDHLMVFIHDGKIRQNKSKLLPTVRSFHESNSENSKEALLHKFAEEAKVGQINTQWQ